MPRNGSGTYTLPSGNPVVAGTTIESTWANTTLSDVATELTNSLSRTGAGGMTGPLRLANGTNSAPSLAFTDETTAGLYRAGAGDFRFVVLTSAVQQWLSSGTEITGTLGASGNFAINTNKFTVAASSGNTVVAGTLGVAGNFAVNTNKFTVAASSGNTLVAGTLDVTGAATLNNFSSSSATLTGGTINSMAIGGVTPAAGAFTTLSASGNVTLSGGTANGVVYLNGSKVATSGTGLVFDGSNLGIGTSSPNSKLHVKAAANNNLEVLSPNIGTGIRLFARNDTGTLNRLELQGGQVIFPLFTGADGMYFDATSGNLGIGTSSPTNISGFTSLTLNANGGGNAIFDFKKSDTLHARLTGASNLFDVTADVITFTTGSIGSGTLAERMRLDASGNLSIGTTSIVSGFPLYVYNASSGGIAFGNSTASSTIGQSGGDVYFDVNRTGSAGNLIFRNSNSFTERMRLDSSGNLGIGTSTHGTQSDRYLTVYAGSNPTLSLRNFASGTGNNTGFDIFLSGASSETNIYVRGSADMLFGTSNNERMRLTSGGNLGIGTSSPGLRLHVVDSSSLCLFEASDTTIGPYVTWRNGATSIGDVGSHKGIQGIGNATDFMIASRSTYSLIFGTNNTERMRLDSAGNLGIGTSSPAQKLDLVGAFKLSEFIEGAEQAAPAAPAANGYRIYAEDNGSGKTRLMVLFATGAAQQLAIEP